MSNARGELKSLDEYVFGADGDGEHALPGKIREVYRQAREKRIPVRKDGEETAEVREIERITVTGNLESANESRQFLARSFAWKAVSVDQLAGILRQSLELEPGPSFAGTIRLYFRAEGDSSVNLGSYSRAIRPAFLGTIPAEAQGNPALVFQSYIAPLLDRQLQTMDRSNAMLATVLTGVAAITTSLGALADRLKSQHEAQNGILGLLGTALNVGAAAGVPGAAQAQNVVSAAAKGIQASGVSPRDLPTLTGPTGSPDLPKIPGVVPPAGSAPAGDAAPADSGSTTISDAQVRAWAEANPDSAKELVREALRKGGAPDMMIQFVK